MSKSALLRIIFILGGNRRLSGFRSRSFIAWHTVFEGVDGHFVRGDTRNNVSRLSKVFIFSGVLYASLPFFSLARA